MVFQRFFAKRKHTAELNFQREWAKEFQDHQQRVREYWSRYRYLEDINSICGFEETTRVLDVGCGISSVLHYIPGDRYGIDPLAEEYQKLYSYPAEIKIQKASGENLPFADEFFDVVFCSNVLDHIDDPGKTIEQVVRVLRPKGYFILTVEIFTQKHKRDAAHPHSLLKNEVEQLISGRFEKLAEYESPWIGLQKYVKGDCQYWNQELILILQKYL